MAAIRLGLYTSCATHWFEQIAKAIRGAEFFGGYFCVLKQGKDGDGQIDYHLVTLSQVGWSFPESLWEEHCNRAQDLAFNLSHRSDLEHSAGAVRVIDGDRHSILAFSGLPEILNKTMVLVVALNLDRLNYEQALKIAQEDSNPEACELLGLWRSGHCLSFRY